MRLIRIRNDLYMRNRAVGLVVAKSTGPEFLHSSIRLLQGIMGSKFSSSLTGGENGGGAISVHNLSNGDESVVRLTGSDFLGETYMVKEETAWEESYMDPLALRFAMAIIATEVLRYTSAPETFNPLNDILFSDIVVSRIPRNTFFVNQHPAAVAGSASTYRRKPHLRPLMLVIMAHAHKALPHEYRDMFFSGDNVISLRRQPHA